jgi:hypothetical protein
MIDEGSFEMTMLFLKCLFIAWGVFPLAIGFLLGIKVILRR